jgi:hypothetical protein
MRLSGPRFDIAVELVAAFLGLQPTGVGPISRRTGISAMTVSRLLEPVQAEARRIFGPGVGEVRSRRGPKGG